MRKRTNRLAQVLVRQAALHLPEPVFLGWAHFLAELNKFVNEYVRKKPGDPLKYITLEGEPTRNRAVLNLYLEDEGHEGWNPQKMIQAVKYFAGEMGVQVGQEQRASRSWQSALLPVEGLPTYTTPENHARLRNKHMKKGLESGQMIDVQMVGMEVEPGVFRLNEFISEVPYVDSETETPIRSIGRDKESGEILAATDDRFFHNPDYECLYLP